jgi:hypothetical protein
MEEFPRVLTTPRLLAGPVLEASHQGLLIDMQETPIQVRPHPVAQDASNLLIAERRGYELVGNFSGNNLIRSGGLAGEERQGANYGKN